MNAMDAMRETARELVAPGKGILAADESTGTIKKRFDSIDVENTEHNRRAYRQMLFTTPGFGEHISGVILYDETIRQSADDGRRSSTCSRTPASIPGIKVDTGAKPLARLPRRDRHRGTRRAARAAGRVPGARRPVREVAGADTVGGDLPTDFAILANMHAMARYAALCQEADIVPIVEPEVLMDGDHDLAACEAATGRTLQVALRAARPHRVDLPGDAAEGEHDRPGQGQRRAGRRRRDRRGDDPHAPRRDVPAEVPGIVFLSGGMTDEQATSRLNEMNRSAAFPWELSFCYGRALQAPSLAGVARATRRTSRRGRRARAPGADERARPQRRVDAAMESAA